MERNTAKKFFSLDEQKRIVLAIQRAERKTSCEIRLHVDTQTNLHVLDRAAYLFKQLDMHKTEARNGVLLYVAVKNKEFAIIGDSGVNYYVKDAFWTECKEEVLPAFKAHDFCEGIIACIEKVGNRFQEYFPYQEDDENELSDELSFE